MSKMKEYLLDQYEKGEVMPKLAIKEWVEDRQENGDDGTGHCDYKPEMCDYCKENADV